MKRMLVILLMFTMLLTQSVGSYAEDNLYESMGTDGIHSIFETRHDGVPGYQWYEESWTQLEIVSFAVDKKGTCTSITLFDRMRGMKLSFDFEITKDKLSKYKLIGNKFFYNYQADWFQVETKNGIVIYTDMPADPLNGETYNITTSK